MSEQVIVCPKCGSEQLTAGKHGYSAGKAVAGAVITGGIGLLAGFHGSKKIDIVCLACGHKFKPGEGKIKYKSDQPIRSYIPPEKGTVTSGDQRSEEQIIKDALRTGGLERGIQTHMKLTGWEYATSKQRVIEIAHIYGIKDPSIPKENVPNPKSSGCLVSFIILLIIGTTIAFLYL